MRRDLSLATVLLSVYHFLNIETALGANLSSPSPHWSKPARRCFPPRFFCSSLFWSAKDQALRGALRSPSLIGRLKRPLSLDEALDRVCARASSGTYGMRGVSCVRFVRRASLVCVGGCARGRRSAPSRRAACIVSCRCARRVHFARGWSAALFAVALAVRRAGVQFFEPRRSDR